MEKKKLKILVAPLDWGLGHATRCIPVIRLLRSQGHSVSLAGEGGCAAILRDHFPDLPLLPLRGYRVRYSRSKTWFTLTLLSQLPGIMRAIRYENKWLEQKIREEAFDLVISDNRYGLFSSDIPSAILTHQLSIPSGKGTLADSLLRFLHYRLLRRFSACWVVDTPGSDNLGGSMSHPPTLPANARYVGLLSQFIGGPSDLKISVPSQIVILLSGPEPTRTLLEEKLIRQASSLTQYTITVIGGVPGKTPPSGLPANIRYHSSLSGSTLHSVLAGCELVICRSGYSTVMDLAVLGKNALLIPTPGQTEQEYLAAILSERRVCYTRSEKNINLDSDVPAAMSWSGFQTIDDQKTTRFLEDALQRLIELGGDRFGKTSNNFD